MTDLVTPPDDSGGDAQDDALGRVTPDLDRRRSKMSPGRAVLVVVAAGLLLTGVASWAAWTLNRNNEHRLLEVQAHQAAEVLNSTILEIRDPLQTSLAVARLSSAGPTDFASFMAVEVGPQKLFASVELWQLVDGIYQPQVTLGAPELTPSSPIAQSLVATAGKSPTFVVRSFNGPADQRVAYALGSPADPRYVILAERVIPANRVVPAERNAAFSDLEFATYLGPRTDLAALATTNVPLDQLPLSGSTTRVQIPFGDTTLTLEVAPRGELGGSVGANATWIILVTGLALTAVTAVVAAQLVARRRAAESDAATIAGLYSTLDTLYGDQRSIAETLQRALLPQRNPSIARFDAATRYVPGSRRVEVGGDWYSVIAIDDDAFAFSIGDVSGKGVDAAAIMARLRFTIRAYLTEGHPPDIVLHMCSRQLDVTSDGHFCTVLVGVGDVRTGSLTMASAGHFAPLLVSGGTASFVKTDVGLPLGVEECDYRSTLLQLRPGDTFVAFTDGLVERRDESIDTGLARLADTASRLPEGSGVEETLDALISGTCSDRADDDMTVLALRWTGHG